MKLSDVPAMLVLVALVVAGIFLALGSWEDKEINWKYEHDESTRGLELKRTVGRYFALLWVALGLILVLVLSAQALAGSVPFHTAIEMVLAGTIVGLVFGKAL